MSENIVSGRGIVKTFKDFWGRDKVKALKGIDLDIPKGSIFGLLGPNGAGKSTLIKILLGHLYPTSGKIAVFGKDPRDVDIKFKIGYLPERSYLYKSLTALETLKYFGEILNLSPEQIKSRSSQLLEMVGLQNSAKRYIGEFSHGMTRRMGMAQALLNDPEFIILDEPTAGLDPIGCREVKDLILTLAKRGKTILLTSHLLADVEDVCDDVMVIFGGTVQSQGRMQDLLADENRVKVEFSANETEKLQKVKEVLGSSAEFSSPKQSLESYFLKIVSESRGLETAGAQAGTGVASYLRGDDSADERSIDSQQVEKEEVVKEPEEVIEAPQTKVEEAEKETKQVEKIDEAAKTSKKSEEGSKTEVPVAEVETVADKSVSSEDKPAEKPVEISSAKEAVKEPEKLEPIPERDEGKVLEKEVEKSEDVEEAEENQPEPKDELDSMKASAHREDEKHLSDDEADAKDEDENLDEDLLDKLNL